MQKLKRHMSRLRNIFQKKLVDPIIRRRNKKCKHIIAYSNRIREAENKSSKSQNAIHNKTLIAKKRWHTALAYARLCTRCEKMLVYGDLSPLPGLPPTTHTSHSVQVFLSTRWGMLVRTHHITTNIHEWSFRDRKTVHSLT